MQDSAYRKKHAERQREWRLKNPEKQSEYNRKWREKNPEKVKQHSEKYRGRYEYQRNYMQKLKEAVINHYSPNHVCQWKGCTWTDSDALSVDHINNDGAEHFRKLGKGRHFGGRQFYLWLIRNNFPKGFQILCMNHQWLKRAEYYRKRK